MRIVFLSCDSYYNTYNFLLGGGGGGGAAFSCLQNFGYAKRSWDTCRSFPRTPGWMHYIDLHVTGRYDNIHPLKLFIRPGADPGFPEGGGGVKTFTSTPPPPGTLSAVTSSALQKMTNTPTLGHSQAPHPPWTLSACRYPPPEKLKNTPTLAHSQAPPPWTLPRVTVIHIYLNSLLKKKIVVESRGGVTFFYG